MMLYTLIADHNLYAGTSIDSDYVASIVGSLRGERREDRIDVNHRPRKWKGIFPSPVKVKFVQSDESIKKSIPDIGEFQGRLYLNQKAYDALEQLLMNDGEFIPAMFKEEGYIFTPLSVASVDNSATVKNEWDEITSLGFKEESVKGMSIFRTEFNGYMRLYCQEQVKQAIQDNNLTGLYITADLANIFPEDRSSVEKAN